MKTAIYKDFGADSGKYNSRMNYIYTPSNCFKYDEKTKKNVIEVYRINHGKEDTPKELQDGQLKKMLGDFGANSEEIEQALATGKYEGNGITIIIGEKTADEIRENEAKRFQENNDIVEMNKSLEKGRNECKEVSETFMTHLVEKIGPKDLTSFSKYNSLCKQLGMEKMYNQAEFEKLSDEEKMDQIKDVLSKAMLDKANTILEGREE